MARLDRGANAERRLPAGEVSPSTARDLALREVVRRIEEDVIFGRLAPGARLVEDRLMARHGASRHCIRQALVQLEQVGLVRREKNIGATVRSYSADEVGKIYEVREFLTRQAVLSIPLPAPDDVVEELVAIQERYKGCIRDDDLRGVHEANDAFHLVLFSACGNPYLVRTLQDYMSLTLPMRAKNLADRAGREVSVRQHDIMIDLLRGGDRWALAQLCVEHLQTSKADYLARVASGAGRPRVAAVEDVSGS